MLEKTLVILKPCTFNGDWLERLLAASNVKVCGWPV